MLNYENQFTNAATGKVDDWLSVSVSGENTGAFAFNTMYSESPPSTVAPKACDCSSLLGFPSSHLVNICEVTRSSFLNLVTFEPISKTIPEASETGINENFNNSGVYIPSTIAVSQ